MIRYKILDGQQKQKSNMQFAVYFLLQELSGKDLEYVRYNSCSRW